MKKGMSRCAVVKPALFGVAILATVLVSCTDSETEIGSDFFDDVSFEVLSWDTLTLKMSTVQLDSIVTSDAARLLVGIADHDQAGRLTAETYFQVGNETYTNFPSGADFSFTHASLILHYDGYSFGDTTQYMEIEVHELAEDLELDDDDQLYNFSSFTIKTESENTPFLLGTHTFRPEPYTGDSIEIDLDLTRGRELFDFLGEDEVLIDDFKEFFKGVHISSSTEGCILGFGLSAELRLYYNDYADEDPEEQYLGFELGTSDYYFNHLSADRSATTLASLSGEEISSDDAGDRVFVQSGLGLAIRIDIPYIRDILARDDELLINNVELELAVGNELPEELSMLQNLAINRVDDHMDLLRSYEMPISLDVNSEYGYDRKYTLDITDFIEEQIANNVELNEDGLLLRFEDESFRSSVDHLILWDQHGGDENSKIKLNVIRIKQ